MPIPKLLLTSAGLATPKIQQALVDLVGKPIHESSALYVPTAIYAYAQGIKYVGQLLQGVSELGWQSFGLLELTALPSLPQAIWQTQLAETDVLIVGGGNKFYLSYWMQKSGLFATLPQRLAQGMVYMGVSGGSMLMTAELNFDTEQLAQANIYYDDQFDEEMSAEFGSAETLGLVDFVVRPHLNANYFPQATHANMQRWAKQTAKPLYALDDQSALKIIDGKVVEVISDGE